MGVTGFQQSLYEFFDSGLLFRIALLQKTILFLLLLETAYAQAHEKAGITWEGQEFLVQGNPAVLANSSAEDDAKEN